MKTIQAGAFDMLHVYCSHLLDLDLESGGRQSATLILTHKVIKHNLCTFLVKLKSVFMLPVTCTISQASP